MNHGNQRTMTTRAGLRQPGALLAGLAVLVMIAGCATAGGSAAGSSGKGPITIALLAPFTGQYGYFGKEFATGAAAAAAEINAGGGVLGRPVHILNADDAGDPIDARSAMNKLVAFNNIAGVIGPLGGESEAIQPIIDRHKIPNLVLAGDVYYDKNGDTYVWRATPSDSQLGVAMALYARSKGYTRAALMFDTETSAQQLQPVVAATFKRLGGSIVASVNLALDQTSYRSEVARIASAHPQVIFTSLDIPTASALFTNFQQYDGLAIPFIGTDSTSGSDFVKGIGGPRVAHKALVSLVGGSELGGGGATFNHWYRQTAHQAPVTNADFAYDATMVLALAIQKAGSTAGPAIVQAIPGVSNPPGTKVSSWPAALQLIKAGKKINYDGASGPMDYNKYHNIFGPFDAVQVQPNGQVTILRTFTAAQLGAATG
jgi:branched-chain amino acid transport system substrate-binding protein